MTNEAIAVNVSGEMERQPDQTEHNKILANLLHFPIQVPQAREWITQRRQNIRPWLQFVQTSNLKAPPSLARLSRRIIRNLEYFQSNYLFVSLGLCAYCLLTSPLLLLAVSGSLFAGYKLSRRHITGAPPVKIFGRELSTGQQHMALAACSMPVFYLVGAGAALFWTLGASCLIVSLHAAFYNIDALITEPEDSFRLTQEV